MTTFSIVKYCLYLCSNRITQFKFLCLLVFFLFVCFSPKNRGTELQQLQKTSTFHIQYREGDLTLLLQRGLQRPQTISSRCSKTRSQGVKLLWVPLEFSFPLIIEKKIEPTTPRASFNPNIIKSYKILQKNISKTRSTWCCAIDLPYL